MLAKYAEEHEVYLLFSTDGRYGVNDFSGIPAGDSLVQIRKKEAACSCASLGIHPPIFLDIQDGMGLNGHGNFYEQEALLKEGLMEAIRKIRPSKIITLLWKWRMSQTSCIFANLSMIPGKGIPSE